MSDQNLHPKETILFGYEDPPKALWICIDCDKPLGDEGVYDTYHDIDGEPYHTNCCPKCSQKEEETT